MNKIIVHACIFIISNTTHSSNNHYGLFEHQVPLIRPGSDPRPPVPVHVLHRISDSNQPVMGTPVETDQPVFITVISPLRETDRLVHSSRPQHTSSEGTCREVVIIFSTVFSVILIATGTVYGIIAAVNRAHS